MFDKKKEKKIKSALIIFKNGKSLRIRCNYAKVDLTGGRITGYSFEGLKGSMPLYIDIEQIMCVTYR